MHCPRVRHGIWLGLTALLLSCFGGAPHAPVAGTLAPSMDGTGPRTRSVFAVVFAGPRGIVADLQQPAVTVLFNRGMRDPETSEDSGIPAVKLAREDGRPVTGSWRWVGTHGLLFTPDHALSGSTRFTVVVPAGTRSLDGDVLTAPYSFDFATVRPALREVAPPAGATDVRPDAVFRLVFNQPMNPAEVERVARLVVRTQGADGGTGAAKGGAPARSIALKASRPAKEKNVDDVVVLTPTEKLPLDSEVLLSLDKGLHGEGPLGTESARKIAMRSYGPIRLADVRCPRSSGPRCQAHRDLTVVLSNRVDEREFKAHLKTPGLPLRTLAPAELARKAKVKLLPSTDHLVQADPDYGKRYRMTLTSGLRDVFGQKLATDITFDVDTEAPFLAAGVPVSGGGTPAAAEDDSNASSPSPDPADPRPVRARLDYAVKFGLRGHVFEALAKQGIKSHAVPIGSVNIPSYATVATQMREEEVLAWLTNASHHNGPGNAGWRWNWVTPGGLQNVRSVRTVDVDGLLGGPNAKGSALLAVALPGSMQSPSTELVTVTDLAVSAEVSRYGTLVWVTHLSTGAPVSNARVSVVQPGKSDLFATTTDAQGIATLPSESWNPLREEGSVDTTALFVVHAGDDWTYQRVVRSAASYRSGVDTDLAQRGEWAGLLYTDRGVYRPGESIKLAALIRRVDAAGLKAVEGEEIRVALEDSEGEKVFDGRAKLDAFGEATLDVPIPKTSHLGQARVLAEVARKKGEPFVQEILLAAYKASEFKVGLDPNKTAFVRGDTATFAVHADYLFGAPMGDASLHNHVSRHTAYFPPPQSEGFITDDEANTWDHPEADPRAEELRVDDGRLDVDGRYETTVKLDLPRMRGPEEVTFETEVEDLTHQTVAKSATVRVHPASFYLGVGRTASSFLAVGRT